ncbi:extracellular solute-binding protein [Streptomyces sp. NPDC059218]|uniref:extracellular solute-binding protein n=1 Tax=unclassified Streptomyces TaxID=2593676 RepID=UPI0036791803
MQASSSGGKEDGVPFVADTTLYLYNKTLFAKAGLDPNKPPPTWAGITHAADAITKLGNGVTSFYISGGPRRRSSNQPRSTAVPRSRHSLDPAALGRA